MRAPPPPATSSTSSQKQKSLSIHIATDHIGPSKMPLVYGSTPDRIGSIRGTVRFSTNYPCKGKDIVIMYEAKAEAQWSALENKKVVRHQTEEILGYHIWHFPLEHTKSGGSTVAVGVYEKEFEVPLVHPSVSLRGWPVVNTHNSLSSPSPSSLPPSPSPSASAGFAAPSAAAHPSKINSAHYLPHTTAMIVGAKPVGPVGSTTTTTTSITAATSSSSGLLPSSSYSPQARVKYTIRAILQRPFPSITHVEASQEVWVLNSSLPPQFPLMSSLSSSTSTSRRSHSNASSKKRRQTTTAKAGQTTSSNSNSPPTEKGPSADSVVVDSKSPTSPESEEAVLNSQSLLSLSMPSQVLKSAFALLPTIDLSRSKQLFSISKTGSPIASESASESGSGSGARTGAGTGASASSSQPSTSATTATAATSSASVVTKDTTATSTATSTAATTPAVTADTDATSDAGSTSSCASVSSPRLNGTGDNYLGVDNENIADYTGVWEAFDIPYSLSVPSEMVYLGQVVPLTIKFGPQRGYCSNNSNNNNNNNNNRVNPNGNDLDASDERNLPKTTSSRRFAVKKGVLRLVEHTLLREVTTAQVPTPKGSHGNNNNNNNNKNNNKKHTSKSLALTTNAHHGSSQATLEESFEDSSYKDSSHRRAFSEHNPQSNNGGNDGKAKPRTMLPMFGKRQGQNAIYQEQGYHGSHSHLPLPGGGGDSGAVQQQQQQRTQHQHQLSLPGGGSDAQAHQQQQQHQGDLRRSFFKPNRHSMDVSAGRPVSLVNPYGPTIGNISNPRIVSSVEAKFKTEVMFLSLTPFLQRQEQWYQRQLMKAGTGSGTLDESDIDQDQDELDGDGNDDEEEREGDARRMYVEEEDVEEDIEEGVWQTTIWVPIPGPSAMATFTETKNIVKTHTLQLILLCGFGEGAAPSSPAVMAPQGEGDADSGSVSAVSLSNVNKEFRIEITGPRAPVEMSIKHP
ncbi:hypothetical protein BGZ95_007307, partial [Linnemannia exigua]